MTKAKEMWAKYLQKYPESMRSFIIKEFLQNGTRVYNENI